jgi:hypothetical protein
VINAALCAEAKLQWELGYADLGLDDDDTFMSEVWIYDSPYSPGIWIMGSSFVHGPIEDIKRGATDKALPRIGG